MGRPDEQREGRIRALLRFIKEDCHGETTISNLYRFAIQSFGYGFRISTIESYIKVLIMTGEITVNDGHVKVVKKDG